MLEQLKTDCGFPEMFKKFEEEYRAKIANGMTPTQIKEELDKNEVENYNNKKGALKYVDCKICNNKGEIAILEDGEIKYRPCTCIKLRYAYQLIEEQGLADSVERLTFHNYTVSDKWQEEVKDKALRYSQSALNEWFAVFGQSGSGKTHICTAIVGELMRRGVPVVYMPYAEDMQILIADYYEKDIYLADICNIKYCECLYIDDFMKNYKENSNEAKIVFEIIDFRYKNKLATIISSEITLSALMGIDIAIAGRIKERCDNYLANIKPDLTKNKRF